MSELLLVVALLVPPVLVAVLKHTRLFWLPGAVLIASSIAVLTVWPFETDHGEASGLNGLANFVHLMIAAGLFVYGALCWLVAARIRKPPRSE